MGYVRPVLSVGYLDRGVGKVEKGLNQIINKMKVLAILGLCIAAVCGLFMFIYASSNTAAAIGYGTVSLVCSIAMYIVVLASNGKLREFN